MWIGSEDNVERVRGGRAWVERAAWLVSHVISWCDAMNPEEFGFVQQLVDRFLDDRNLSVSQPQPCPYLPGLSARHEGFLGEELPGAVYRALMDRGFRRSGRLVYRPVCADCNACRQVRVPHRR